MATNDRVLMHHGVLGMHWGVRKAEQYTDSASAYDRGVKRNDRRVRGNQALLRKGGGRVITAWRRYQVNAGKRRSEYYKEMAGNYRDTANTLRKREKKHPGDFAERVLGTAAAAGSVAYTVGYKTCNVPLAVAAGAASGVLVDHIIRAYNDNHPEKKKN